MHYLLHYIVNILRLNSSGLLNIVTNERFICLYCEISAGEQGSLYLSRDYTDQIHSTLKWRMRLYNHGLSTKKNS